MYLTGASLVAQRVKCLRETWVQFLCQEDPLEEEIATHSSTLQSHGWRSLVGYSPWGRKESDTTERLHYVLNYHTCQMYILSQFLPSV